MFVNTSLQDRPGSLLGHNCSWSHTPASARLQLARNLPVPVQEQEDALLLNSEVAVETGRAGRGRAGLETKLETGGTVAWIGFLVPALAALFTTFLLAGLGAGARQLLRARRHFRHLSRVTASSPVPPPLPPTALVPAKKLGSRWRELASVRGSNNLTEINI